MRNTQDDPQRGSRLPVVVTTPPPVAGCRSTRRIPGTAKVIRCGKRHLDPVRDTFHFAVLQDSDGPVNVGWGDLREEVGR